MWEHSSGQPVGLYWKTINELVKGPQAQHSLSSSSSAVIQAGH